MSGGVDSSVSALILKNQGNEIGGVTLMLKPLDILTEEEKLNINKEAEDARAVCDKLEIEHFAPNYSEFFREKVIDYFTNEYFSGRTPNPCIMCNQNLKFGVMLDFALNHGYDYLATGHYAQIEEKNGRFLLKKADNPKDQSYFLYGMTQHQLAHTVFPLNTMEKRAARALASEYGLPVANKPDSQEVCFIKHNNYVSFIEEYSGKKAPKGEFVDEDGNILGEHQGIYRYTIGQRKGLGVTFGEPRFVTNLNAKENKVTLGVCGSQYKSELVASNLNFIPFDELKEEMTLTAKVRYQAKPAKAKISPLADGRVSVIFEEPQRSVTPGQAVVFYDGDIVVGGGIIQ